MKSKIAKISYFFLKKAFGLCICVFSTLTASPAPREKKGEPPVERGLHVKATFQPATARESPQGHATVPPGLTGRLAGLHVHLRLQDSDIPATEISKSACSHVPAARDPSPSPHCQSCGMCSQALDKKSLFLLKVNHLSTITAHDNIYISMVMLFGRGSISSARADSSCHRRHELDCVTHVDAPQKSVV